MRLFAFRFITAFATFLLGATISLYFYQQFTTLPRQEAKSKEIPAARQDLKTNSKEKAEKNQAETNDDEEVNSLSSLKCGDKDFDLTAVYKNGKENIDLTQNANIVKTINLPTQSDAQGFSLNWAKQNKGGFEISIEWGSRNYYNKQFNFVCKKDKFYLNEVIINTFDKQDPENSWKKYRTRIKPALPLEKFLITDYMVH
jgi:hypothetical protein